MFLLQLIESEQPSLCLKAIKILNVICDFFVEVFVPKCLRMQKIEYEEEDSEFFDQTEAVTFLRLTISQLISRAISTIIEKYRENSSIEFQGLILLRSLFTVLLPPTTAQNELLKPEGISGNITSTLESLRFNSLDDELLITSPLYAAVRMNLVLKMFPFVEKHLLQSSWINAKVLSCSLLCEMVKIDTRCFEKQKI